MKGRPNIRNKYILLGDLLFIVVVVLGSYVLGFEMDALFFQYLPSAYWMVGVALLVKPLIYYFFGLYRRMWLYASVQELKLIVIAATAASVILSVIMVSLLTFGVLKGFPRRVLVIDWLLSIMAVGGLRFALRVLV